MAEVRAGPNLATNWEAPLSNVVTVLPFLHPIARAQFEALADELLALHASGVTKTLFLPFEGFRTPQRQRELYHSEPRVTNADAWQSAHQYGMAVDFVPQVGGRWSWAGEHDWKLLPTVAERHGLTCPIPWDSAHVEHPRARQFLRMK